MIELYIPQSAGIDFKLRTVTGLILTDFKMDYTKEYKGTMMRLVGGLRKVDYSRNGGGVDVDVDLNTVSGKIVIKLN